ncbi:MAG: hypothetical protein ABR537_11005 [Gemmatimonadales bacterium]
MMLLLTALLVAQLPYDVPPGWDRTQDPQSGIVTLTPRGLANGHVVVLRVVPPVTFAGSAAEFHNEIVRRASTGARLLEQPVPGSEGGFLATTVHQLMPAGIALWFRVYTARWEDRAETILLVANTPDDAAKFSLIADSMVAHITVPHAAAATPAPAAPAAAAAPLVAGQIEGVYVTLKNKSGYGFGVSKDYMVFFRNGEVLWHLPEEGLLNYDQAHSHQEWKDFWGRYAPQGARFHLTFNTGPDYSGMRNRDGSLLIGGYTYVRQSSGADGRTLSGTYRPYNVGADPSRDVTFYPDGRFEDRGIRGAVGALDLAYGRAKVPTGPGRGRYRIAQYSIVFEYSDGRREQLSFYVPDDDGGTTPKQLVINTFSVVRVAP